MQYVAKTVEMKRRSTRIQLHLPVRVSSCEPSVPFCEHCYTLIVNLQGCGVRVPFPVRLGLPVVIDELPTGVTMSGRVVNCVPLGSEGKFWLVGLAFDHPANVWAIDPVPPDWETVTRPETPNSTADDSPSPATTSGKHAAWPYSMFSDRGEAHPGRR